MYLLMPEALWKFSNNGIREMYIKEHQDRRALSGCAVENIRVCLEI